MFSPKTKSPGQVPLKKSHSVTKGTHESKFVKSGKKWVDRHTGKEVNFKKYLEIKFFIKGEEVDKTKTMHEILSKYKNRQSTYIPDDLVIEYKLVPKKPEPLSPLNNLKDPKIHNLILNYKQYLQTVLSNIVLFDLKSDDKNLKETIQLMMLIKELVAMDRRILSPASPFYSLLIDLRSKCGLGELLDLYQKDGELVKLEQVLTKQDFINEKFSNIVDKYVTDPLTLTAGVIPDMFKSICENASFLLNYPTKYHYYKHTGFHISRALYYIYQANKNKLKDLESTRIGKLTKKKIKVSRDRILENSVVNMESYGHKKVQFNPNIN